MPPVCTSIRCLSEFPHLNGKQISDSEEISERVAVFEQIFSFSDGFMTINFEAIKINTDDLSIDSLDVDVDSDLRVRGKLRADKIKTDFIESEAYTHGAGNVW